MAQNNLYAPTFFIFKQLAFYHLQHYKSEKDWLAFLEHSWHSCKTWHIRISVFLSANKTLVCAFFFFSLKVDRPTIFIIYCCTTNHPKYLWQNYLLCLTSLCVSWMPLLIWPGLVLAGLLYIPLVSCQFCQGHRVAGPCASIIQQATPGLFAWGQQVSQKELEVCVSLGAKAQNWHNIFSIGQSTSQGQLTFKGKWKSGLLMGDATKLHWKRHGHQGEILGTNFPNHTNLLDVMDKKGTGWLWCSASWLFLFLPVN